MAKITFVSSVAMMIRFWAPNCGKYHMWCTGFVTSKLLVLDGDDMIQVAARVAF